MERNISLQLLILEKAIYELGYELNNRPDWMTISLKGFLYNFKNPIKIHRKN